MPTKHPEKIYKELEQTLCELIRYDTTNPPGNEAACCRYAAETLSKEGIAAEALESAPGRGNVVARLKGDGSRKPLLLMSHVDVVPAVAKDWSVPPFEGVIRDGFLWGRGALDCKNTMATDMLLLLELKRRGAALKRDVILCAFADEECMGAFGAAWMVENHFDKIAAEYALNEGGGNALPFEGRNAYVCQTAEKGAILLRLTTRGRPGHGSVPKKDNAVARMAAALNTIARNPFPIRRTAHVSEMLRRLGGLLPLPKSLALGMIFNPLLSDFILSQIEMEEARDVFRAMIRDTISPTMVNGGYKENVIPEKCEAVIDCRILPGTTQEQFIEKLRLMIDVDEIEPLFPEKVPYATESATDCELYRAIEAVIKEYDPAGLVTPFLLPGATDSRFLRRRGVIAYGFHPLNSKVHPREYISTTHGIDERIPIDALHFGFDVLWDLLLRMAT